MESQDITIHNLCVLCHAELEENEKCNAFPLSTGDCCESCDNTIVIHTRKICLDRGFYYATNKKGCTALINHMKQTGELYRLLMDRFPGLPDQHLKFLNKHQH